jgi:hypothetical protein
MRRIQLVVIALAAASTLAAQKPGETPKRAWVSAGLGYGASPRGLISYLASDWYSTGPIAIGARAAGVGAIFGEMRHDHALLVGATLGGPRDFILDGVGVGSVSSGYATSDSRHSFPSTTAIVYSLEAHPKSVLGLGLTMFGAFGSPLARYTGFAITVNPGWFGD